MCHVTYSIAPFCPFLKASSRTLASDSSSFRPSRKPNSFVFATIQHTVLVCRDRNGQLKRTTQVDESDVVRRAQGSRFRWTSNLRHMDRRVTRVRDFGLSADRRGSCRRCELGQETTCSRSLGFNWVVHLGITKDGGQRRAMRQLEVFRWSSFTMPAEAKGWHAARAAANPWHEIPDWPLISLCLT